MSRTWKDVPYRYGGHRSKWFIVNNHSASAKWKSNIRRRVRRLEHLDLARGVEPQPKYACETEYFD